MWASTRNWNVSVIKKCICKKPNQNGILWKETAACKEVLQDSVINLLSPRPSCSLKGTIHYSDDYAQRVHIPSNPQQPGPIYFKTPRKCGLFGICCEEIPGQVNYLIDEPVATGKGANATISYVHDFLNFHGAGETDAQINADNCGGQSKNNMLSGIIGGAFFVDVTSPFYIHF